MSRITVSSSGAGPSVASQLPSPCLQLQAAPAPVTGSPIWVSFPWICLPAFLALNAFKQIKNLFCPAFLMVLSRSVDHTTSFSQWFEMRPLPRITLRLVMPLSFPSRTPEPLPACMSRESGISIPGTAQGFHIQSGECSWGVPAGAQGSDLPQAQSSVTEASVPTPWLIAVPQVWRAVSSAGPHACTHSPAPCAFS